MDEILDVIARLSWRVAKTMPHIPHEYRCAARRPKPTM
jgi:hypothetical protein